MKDNVESITALASEILDEYEGDPGNTRIERLAKWVNENVANVRRNTAAGATYYYLSNDITVWTVREAIAVTVNSPTKRLTHGDARDLSSALLCAVDAAEG